MSKKLTEFLVEIKNKSNIVIITVNDFDYVNQQKLLNKMLKLHKKYDNIIHCNLDMNVKFIDKKIKRMLLKLQDQSSKYYQLFYNTKNMTYPFYLKQLRHNKIFSRKNILKFISLFSQKVIIIVNAKNFGKKYNSLLEKINNNIDEVQINIWEDLNL